VKGGGCVRRRVRDGNGRCGGKMLSSEVARQTGAMCVVRALPGLTPWTLTHGTLSPTAWFMTISDLPDEQVTSERASAPVPHT
jgi:hypothetical protein